MKSILYTFFYISLLVPTLNHCGGATVEIKIPEEEIQGDLENKFPISQTYGNVAVITLENPSLMLGRRKDRLTIGLSAVVSPTGLGIIEISKGRVVFSSALAFNNSTGLFFLQDVTVDSIQLALNPLEQQVQKGIREAIRNNLQQKIEGTTVYRLKPGKIKTTIAKRYLRKVSIRQDTIIVTLGF